MEALFTVFNCITVHLMLNGFSFNRFPLKRGSTVFAVFENLRPSSLRIQADNCYYYTFNSLSLF